MRDTNRRNMLRFGLGFVTLPGALMALGCGSQDEPASEGEPAPEPQTGASDDQSESTSTGTSMQAQYIEIVSPEADAICESYSKIHGVTFKDPDPSLGGARTAELANGGFVGVRLPLRESETPVVRPYLLVDDIEAAVAAAKEAGAEIAMPATPLPGHGTFAIFIQGGIESGLWQN